MGAEVVGGVAEAVARAGQVADARVAVVVVCAARRVIQNVVSGSGDCPTDAIKRACSWDLYSDIVSKRFLLSHVSAGGCSWQLRSTRSGLVPVSSWFAVCCLLTRFQFLKIFA